MIRRAQHLLVNFHFTKKYAKKEQIYKRSPFDLIWKIEYFLHVLNPWIFLVALLVLLLSISFGSTLALVLAFIGLVFLLVKPYRVWLTQQIYLIFALVNLRTKSEVWAK